MIRAQATLPTHVEHVYVCVFFPLVIEWCCGLAQQNTEKVAKGKTANCILLIRVLERRHITSYNSSKVVENFAMTWLAG